MALFSRELGIDLGTMNSVIVEGNQVIVMEPTVAAIVMEDARKMVEWGQAARDMMGRVSETIDIIRPLQNGVIAEYSVTEGILKEMIKKAGATSFLGSTKIVITAPYG